MLAINILLSGNNYRKIAFLFNFMKIGMVAEPTFFKVQDAYCIEPVEQLWQKIRAEVLTRLKEKDKVVVLGETLFLTCFITVICLWLAMKICNIITFVTLFFWVYSSGDGRMDSPGM